jgi:hypothetical protein
LSVSFSQQRAGYLSGRRFVVSETGGAEASRPIDLGDLGIVSK